MSLVKKHKNFDTNHKYLVSILIIKIIFKMETFDANKDGLLNFEEFMVWWNSLKI